MGGSPLFAGGLQMGTGKITEKRTAAWAADRKEKYETRSINRRFEKIIYSKRYGKNGLWRMYRVLSVL